jgi:hypothetical protein
MISKWVRGHFFSLSRRNARRRTLILTGHVPSITAAFIFLISEYNSVSHPGSVFCVILICCVCIFTCISLSWGSRHCVPSKHLYDIITPNAAVRIIVLRACNLTTIIVRTGTFNLVTNLMHLFIKSYHHSHLKLHTLKMSMIRN